MVTVTATTFKTVIDDSDIADATVEEILDLAIDLLNLFGNLDLANMSGSSGSKSVSVESRQKGGIFLAARAIYQGFYKGIDPVAAGGLTISTHDVLGDPVVVDTVKQAASRLKEFDVDYG